jgi:hypothetical protein
MHKKAEAWSTVQPDAYHSQFGSCETLALRGRVVKVCDIMARQAWWKIMRRGLIWFDL